MDRLYLKGIAEEVVRRVVRDGIANTVFKAARYLFGRGGSNPLQDEFDRKRGVYTSRIEPIWMLGFRSDSSRHAKKYSPIDPPLLIKALERLSSDWSTSTFVDLGCGKGRALIVAAEAGFSEVIGVELSAKLARSANENVKRMKLGNVRVLNVDALEFEYVRSDSLLFMYNPFGPPILKQILEKINVSTQPPRYIIYANPFYDQFFDALQGYELVFSEPEIMAWCRS